MRLVRPRVFVLMVMTVGLLGCGGQVQHTAEEPQVVAPVVAVQETTTTTTAPPPPPPPPPPPAPPAAPAPAPAVPQAPRPPRAPAQVPLLGRLVIPRLGLDTPLYQGESLSIIDHGPSHMPWTALPGEVGNVTIAGHRVTNSRPFRYLDTLQVGDTATFEVASGSYTYEFTGHDIVTPERVDITNQGAEYVATMFACHPPGSAKYRIVSYWKLITPPAPGQPIF
ncbi:MAG: class E sortase [Acidimicrobiales bacterium]|nr:class E sortase [Acidimicrobiales bacterium]